METIMFGGKIKEELELRKIHRMFSAIILVLMLVVVFLSGWVGVVKFQNFRIEMSTAQLIREYQSLVEGKKHGMASFYDYNDEGRPCSALREDCYSEGRKVAASRDHPRGTILKVTHKERSVIVTVTDWVENEDVIIDLSSHSFRILTGNKDIYKIGIIPVRVERIGEVMNYGK